MNRYYQPSKLNRRRLRSVLLIAVTCTLSMFTLGAAENHGAADKAVAEPGPEHASGPVGETSEFSPSAEKPAPASSGECLATAATLEDIRVQRAQLADREKAIQAKEAELTALKAAVEEEFAKLESSRAEILKVEDLSKKENEEKIAKIVETLETMSPKSASVMLAQLDDALAVTAMQRLATPKLAKMMNTMEPRRSARLTELLAGVVRAKSAGPASLGAAATTSNSAKGGEKENGNNTEKRADRAISGKPASAGSGEKVAGR